MNHISNDHNSGVELMGRCPENIIIKDEIWSFAYVRINSQYQSTFFI